MLEIIIPYVSQHTNPVSVIISITSERSLVCLVLIVFTACGRNAKVVRKPAVKPIMVAMLSSIYCIESFRFSPASFEVLVGIWSDPSLGATFVYL